MKGIATLGALVGREADFEVKPGGMVFAVVIVDVRESWGQVHVEIRPIAAGTGSRDQWVAKSSVTNIREAAQPVG